MWYVALPVVLHQLSDRLGWGWECRKKGSVRACEREAGKKADSVLRFGFPFLLFCDHAAELRSSEASYLRFPRLLSFKRTCKILVEPPFKCCRLFVDPLSAAAASVEHLEKGSREKSADVGKKFTLLPGLLWMMVFDFSFFSSSSSSLLAPFPSSSLRKCMASK